MKKLLALFTLLISINCLGQVPSYVPTDSLVGWWPFNGNANDESGNGNNGTNNGATLTTDAQANINSAYHFDGNTQFIEIPHSSSLTFNNNEMSISFWFNIESFPPTWHDILISKQSGSGTSQSGFNIAQTSQTTVSIYISSGGGNFGGAPSIPSNTSNMNIFHHVVITYDNGVGKSYVDGNFLGTISGQTATIGANTLPLLFGKANWSNINSDPFNRIPFK